MVSKLKACDFINCLTCNMRTTIYGVCRSYSLAHAERRNALTFLDYALSSGSDSASRAKAEVDATIKRTNEQVSSLPCASATYDVSHNKHCWCFCPPPSSPYRFVQTHRWYKFEYSICQANNCVVLRWHTLIIQNRHYVCTYWSSELTCLNCYSCSWKLLSSSMSR